MKFEGIYVPIVTPYRENYSINYDALTETVEFLIENGAHGIIVAGTTGEYYAQSPDERVDIMRFVKSAAGDRLPLLVGTGAIRTEDSIKFAEHAKMSGADGLLVSTPYYALPTDQEIAQHFLAIDHAVNLPIMLYNYPGRMGVNIGPKAFDELVQHPNFQSIKESSGDPNRLHMLARNYPQLQLSCGMDDQALEFFAWGASSWVCAGGNFAPEVHNALYQACVIEGDFSKGRQIMSAMLPLMQILEQGGKFIQCIKHGLTLRGIDAGIPRLPLLPLTDEEMADLAKVIHNMNEEIQQATQFKQAAVG